MSNDLLKEGFFGNKEVPACEKLGAIALIGGGSYDKNAISQDGTENSFASLVPSSGGRTTPVIFTYGRPESLNEMAVSACVRSIGFNPEKSEAMFSGSMSDKEVVSDCVNFFRVVLGIDKSKQGEAYGKIVEGKIGDYFEKLRVTDPYLTEHPNILTGLKETIKEVFGSGKEEASKNESKKKQIMD